MGLEFAAQQERNPIGRDVMRRALSAPAAAFTPMAPKVHGLDIDAMMRRRSPFAPCLCAAHHSGSERLRRKALEVWHSLSPLAVVDNVAREQNKHPSGAGSHTDASDDQSDL